MKGVDTIARVRREFFVRGRSLKEISRDLHVSRNTVRKIVRSGATAFEYERRVQPRPKIGPLQDELDGLLSANAARSSRERLSWTRIYEELRGLGYEGGYDAVRRYASAWERREKESVAAAYVPLSFAPGEAYQFDWSHEIVVIAGVTTTVKVAHVRLCHSRMMFVRAYPRESQEMVFDAHDRAFALFKGACERGIYDNMKTAVDAVFTGKARAYNRRFAQMCGHYLVEPVACTPASGWEKGREPGRRGAPAVLLAPPSGSQLRGTERLADRSLHRLGQGASPPRGTRQDDLGDVRGRASKLGPVCRPVRWLPRHSRFDNNKYSVAASAVGRPVEIRAYAERIEIRQEGRVVGTHERAFGRGKTIYDPWHYVPVLARKPGALRNGAPFKD